MKSLLDKMGITPNAMQQDAMHALLRSDKDVVVLSPTGSGKTLAYLLPLTQLVDAGDDMPQAIVVTPGRELALQSATVLKDMGSGLRAMACYGGRMTMDEHRVMRQVRPQIIFGTPGRLNDHLDKGNLSAEHVKYLVIDEFDKCLEMGFQDEMSRLLQSLPHLERRILLSATEAEAIPQFVHMGRVEKVDYRLDDEQVPERVHIYKVRSEQKDKLEALSKLLRSFGDESSIVFLNYRDSVERTDQFCVRKAFLPPASMEVWNRRCVRMRFTSSATAVPTFL